MTPEDLRALRESLDLRQAEMAARMGLSLRTYSMVETGAAPLREIHALAAEHVALMVAAETGRPMLAPARLRKAALDVARAITDG